MSEIKNPILLDIPLELRSQRLLLRTPRAGDGAIVFPSVRDSLAELKLWMPWATDDYSLSGAEEWCRKSAAEFLSRERLPYLIFSLADGRHLGNIGAFDFNWRVPSGELGYWLHSAHTGNGYMTEAVKVMATMLRQALNFRRVQIKSNAKNQKSRRVAELAGFQLEGVLRCDSPAISGGLRDTCVFSIV